MLGLFNIACMTFSYMHLSRLLHIRYACMGLSPHTGQSYRDNLTSMHGACIYVAMPATPINIGQSHACIRYDTIAIFL